MVASYNEETDSWDVPHTESNDDKPRRRRRTKEEMEAARARGEVPDKAPSSRRSSLRAVIADLVQTANVALYSLPWTHEDALSKEEESLLIDGIDKAQQVSPTLKRFIQSGSALSGWGALIYATTIIALPRMARHGLIPVPKPAEHDIPTTSPYSPYEQGYDASNNGHFPNFSPSVASG